ncbi:tetratricopeptide repeat protein [Sandaracinus amylolyticus]|nr:tetratricopeptide repeat protein [Sandaracinus amylolyticus]
MTTRTVLFSIGLAMMAAMPARASAWELFRSENGDVREGNELLAAGDHAGALAAYDRAARALPSEAGVHLDRGLALLAAGQLDPAREALRLATEPPASREIRGAAHYNLGLAFYQQADAAAGEENHEEAQRLFREAADAFRSSLRQVPGNRDAGWNLELALRRIREQEEQQQQQDQQEQQDQQDQQQQDQQDQQQQDQQDQQQQDQQDQQQQDQQDQQQQDQQDQQQDQQDSQQQDQQDDSSDSGERDDQQQQDSQDSQQPGESPEGQREDQPSGESESEASGTQERSLPPDMERVLDALQDGEENLERSMARARGQREQRRVERDW